MSFWETSRASFTLCLYPVLCCFRTTGCTQDHTSASPCQDQLRLAVAFAVTNLECAGGRRAASPGSPSHASGRCRSSRSSTAAWPPPHPRPAPETVRCAPGRAGGSAGGFPAAQRLSSPEPNTIAAGPRGRLPPPGHDRPARPRAWGTSRGRGPAQGAGREGRRWGRWGMGLGCAGRPGCQARAPNSELSPPPACVLPSALQRWRQKDSGSGKNKYSVKTKKSTVIFRF